MKCRNHKDVEAKFICDKCKMPICEDCAMDLRGNKVCKSCIEHSVYSGQDRVERRGFWSRLVFFVLACMPGAAHMQLGLFKRGMQLMLTFIGGIVLVSYSNVEFFLPLVIIPTWFFSFFDAYSARRKMLAGEYVEDAEAYNYQFIVSNKKILGIALIVFGFIGLLNAVDRYFYNYLDLFGIRIDTIYWALKRALIPVVLVASGFLMLSRAKKSNEQETTEDKSE